MAWFDDLPEAKQRIFLARLNDDMAAPVRGHAGGDVGFGCWLLLAYSAYYLRTRHFDLPDGPWREYYDAGRDPLDAFAEIFPPGTEIRA